MSARFWAGAAFVALLALLFLFRRIVRQSGKHAELEEREAFQRRQNEAIIAEGERADAIEEAAQAARRVPVDNRSVAADVLRRSGRLRKTGD